jgi:predicted GNAT family N-acyltransferase
MMLTVNIVKGLENTTIAKDIRVLVFVDEQGFEDEFDEIDDRAWHIEVWDQNRPVAVGRMFESNQDRVYTIGRIAVIKEWRQKNIGRLVMEALENHARQLDALAIELSAQCSAAGFYEKLGYVKVGDVYMDQFCPHIKMVKIL